MLLRGDAAEPFFSEAFYLSFKDGEMGGSELKKVLQPTYWADSAACSVRERPPCPSAQVTSVDYHMSWDTKKKWKEGENQA